ncbi:hypothetical protein FRX31_013187 [Thalictrum thalictroides]|uniref:Uncharacterized protein n=1 Tax=Thalictrum thalictroides TaxID=46969 RepID=A0A7J6WIK1_THATH|nr:hypothetical protein FRX31_013187 [Thalictrum thalictroides]
MPTCPLCRIHINGFNAFDVEAMRFYTENDVIPDRVPRDEPEASPVSSRNPRVRVPTTSSNVTLLSSSEDEEEPSTIPVQPPQDASENNIIQSSQDASDNNIIQSSQDASENDVRQSSLINRDDVVRPVDLTMDSDIES